jgi:S-adenosylmethionine:tRNA ribosyltransferase-isomerase
MRGDPMADTLHQEFLRRTEAYEYDLPPDRIARYPASRRDGSRLLVVEPPGASSESGEPAGNSRIPPQGSPGKGGSRFRHLGFERLPELLAPGDLLVLNESRVLPVRLLGAKPTGARGEVLLIRPVDDARVRWEALVRPGSKLKPGRSLEIGAELVVRIEDGLPDGGRLVALETPLEVDEALERYGAVPLPPYLDRDEEPLDRERYQTVYARVPGSVAAPTAGLHLTDALLDQVQGAGVEVARVTLHVGPGTFRPVESERIDAHEMHREMWEVPSEAAEAVARTRSRGGRVWAVGTTVVRTLESAADPSGRVHPGRGETRLFISPGYRFQVVEGLITNFHLPRSTLLMLVSALAGYETTMAAYEEAIQEGYRFYSYGDAMAILPQPKPAREAESNP